VWTNAVSRCPTHDRPSTPDLNPSTPLPRLFAITALLCLCLAGSGCGYHVGAPYSTEFSTVHVPTFTTDSFRRGFELQLTEAVQKQIELRTPYRLAKADNAETRLTGHVVSINKRVENQTKFDDPRELEMSYGIEIRWENTRTGQVLAERAIPLPGNVVQMMTDVSFAPEAGQSLAVAQEQAAQNLARQIVGMMEEIVW
jgi:hypothetical protein